MLCTFGIIDHLVNAHDRAIRRRHDHSLTSREIVDAEPEIEFERPDGPEGVSRFGG
jgi:hypothetical protein